MKTRPSTANRYLSGKPWLDSGVIVDRITAKGNMRKVIFEDGRSLYTTKAGLVKAVNHSLNKEQKTKALRSIRVSADGTTKATIGGAQKGERKTYASRQGAVNAIKRYYANSKG